ncbi:MAG: hypothetical protein COW30_04985 [Rhodospirillales bacterium CG15_BIG_FIL_POST_REV_8_21_14_020_66_15]|nr:MAG: hypothetical protein COW30_04985 [Rhodospirillales bacterium CG15_BIG_FIL_POST_REV_8_21_14_020_66_15]
MNQAADQATCLPRLKPKPVPAIHPVPEYAVDGQRARWYTEMKAAFQVPWMGVVTMAYAHYPNFFAELWRGLKPLAECRAFVDAFQDNRDFVEREVTKLAPRPITGRLEEMGYASREIAGIRECVEIFSHGNQPYLVTAMIARLLLEGRDMGDNGAAEPFDGRHAPDYTVPFVLMEAHHADAPTRAVFDDVKSVLGLPFVNTDYRAFARWPSYWAAAWSDLRQVAGGEAHATICANLHARILDQVLNGLPNPGGLESAALRTAAEKDAPLAEIIAVARLFQWLLPGLSLNVAFLRTQLLND